MNRDRDSTDLGELGVSFKTGDEESGWEKRCVPFPGLSCSSLPLPRSGDSHRVPRPAFAGGSTHLP